MEFGQMTKRQMQQMVGGVVVRYAFCFPFCIIAHFPNFVQIVSDSRY